MNSVFYKHIYKEIKSQLYFLSQHNINSILIVHLKPAGTYMRLLHIFAQLKKRAFN